MSDDINEGVKKGSSPAYVLSLDVGTTTLRSHIYDKLCNVKGSSSKKIKVIHPNVGWSEMDPELLVDQVKDCINESIRAAGIEANKVTCLGIATQRATFLTWDSETGKPYHNLVTWQDLRASDHVKLWNNSYTMKVTMRLLWFFQNIPKLHERASEGKVMFGCIDTWLLWKLTGGTVHSTDYSCASSTGLYDPFQIEWSSIVCNLVNIPMSIFPEVKDTSGHFGYTNEEFFGAKIPITAIVR
ncbi:hypothetical protein SNE40_001669 [Patella caerulea]|uniref:Carbohydrate kinase FGGY N-terminal domain-containing protein n=1 Tax=Patella caerulea TaxID=87958 RepID=A0AAN8KGF0_PATCE